MSKQNPLWMPEGSVRSILAISGWVAFIYLCIITQSLDALAALVGAVSIYYFETRRNGG